MISKEMKSQIIEKYKRVLPKYPKYAESNTLVIEVKLTNSVNTFSRNMLKSKLSPSHAIPIESPTGATSTMVKNTHSTATIIILFLLSFNVLLTL